MQRMRFTRPFGHNDAGDITEIPDGAAAADYLEPVPDDPEPAAAAPAEPKNEGA